MPDAVPPDAGPAADPRELLRHGYGYALALTHAPAQAETLLREGWITVLRTRGPWRRDFLYAAIRHLYGAQAGAEALAETEAITDHDVFAADAAGTALGDDEVLDGDEATLDRVLGAMTAADREGLYLAAVDGDTVDAVAELTGRSRGTVLTLLTRAARDVRAAFAAAAGGNP